MLQHKINSMQKRTLRAVKDSLLREAENLNKILEKGEFESWACKNINGVSSDLESIKDVLNSNVRTIRTLHNIMMRLC